MDLLHHVDRLEELVASAQKMPIGSRAIVDRRRLLDIVDQMRIAVPREVREAQDMMVRREMLEREAEEEARMIIARAEQDAARLAEDHAITEAARRVVQRLPRDDADDGNARGPHLRRLRQDHERHEAAVRTPVDADAARRALEHQF